MQKTALATTPAVLLGQAGQMPFSNYVMKPELLVPLLAAAAVSLCAFEGLLRPCVHFPATVGFRSPFLAGLACNLGASPHLELQDYRNEV